MNRFFSVIIVYSWSILFLLLASCKSKQQVIAEYKSSDSQEVRGGSAVRRTAKDTSLIQLSGVMRWSKIGSYASKAGWKLCTTCRTIALETVCLYGIVHFNFLFYFRNFC